MHRICKQTLLRFHCFSSLLYGLTDHSIHLWIHSVCCGPDHIPTVVVQRLKHVSLQWHDLVQTVMVQPIVYYTRMLLLLLLLTQTIITEHCFYSCLVLYMFLFILCLGWIFVSVLVYLWCKITYSSWLNKHTHSFTHTHTHTHTYISQLSSWKVLSQ